MLLQWYLVDSNFKLVWVCEATGPGLGAMEVWYPPTSGHILLVPRSESSRQMAVKPTMFWVTMYPSIGPQKLKMSLVCCTAPKPTGLHWHGQVALVLGPHPTAYQLLYESCSASSSEWYGNKESVDCTRVLWNSNSKKESYEVSNQLSGVTNAVEHSCRARLNSSTFAQWSYVYQACRKGV